MFNDQVVTFVALKERRIRFDSEKTFSFRKDRPAPWLQRWCFFILKKLKAFQLVETVEIERHRIDGHSLIDRLIKQEHTLIGFFNMKPSRILIGSEDYANLMHEIASTQPFSFYINYVHEEKILGLTIEVIPWMSGILVMPDTLQTFKA